MKAWSIESYRIMGSDYVFPRVANWLIRQYIQSKQATIVGERYIPMAARDMMMEALKKKA